MNIVELVNEKVEHVNPGLPTKKDNRYMVTLQFKIRGHLWWIRMNINANDQQLAIRQAYDIAKMDLKSASIVGVKFVRGDANLVDKKIVNATPRQKR